MPDHHERNDLRPGTWLPAHRDGDDRLPVLSPYPRPPVPPAPPPHRVRRVLIACGLAVAAGAAGVLTLVVPDREEPPAPVAERMVFPTPPESPVPVSVLPAPTRTSASPERTVRSRATAVAGDRTTTHWPAPTEAGRPVRPTPAADLTVGGTVGLEVADLPGFRVRHRDFVGRVDRITSGSSTLDRLDSRFAVRAGLARAGCVSFESVNHPGYFLRHRDFVIRLDRRDRSRLFTLDATFCPAIARNGTAFVLESINYPSRAIAVRRDLSLRLDHGGTAFVARAPL